MEVVENWTASSGGGGGGEGVLTIYMKYPEILVGKSNGTHHSIWCTSEIMGFWSK